MSDQRAPSALVVSPPPHLGVGMSSAAMAWLAAAALLPAAAWGALLFGPPALLVLAVSVGTALAAEALSSLAMRRFTLPDGSALLTGLIVGLFLPPGAPLYVPAAAAGFAILVVKQSFGGLGRNWMNPAMGGILFATISWGAALSAGAPSAGVLGAVAGQPPLEALRAARAAGTGGAPLAALQAFGYAFGSLDAAITDWLNGRVLTVIGVTLSPGTFDMLVGRVAGAIGGVSVPALALGAAFLIRGRVVRWQIPTAFLAVFTALTLAFGGLASGPGWRPGPVCFHLFSGTLVLGAFFVAVDPVTSPLDPRARWLYGVILGCLAFLMRFLGSLGDGVAASIALGNCLVPLLDRRLTQRRAARKGGQ
jgi:Na+-translocating ferredoxin:NAD+ oxidoreductase subunit D